MTATYTLIINIECKYYTIPYYNYQEGKEYFYFTLKTNNLAIDKAGTFILLLNQNFINDK